MIVILQYQTSPLHANLLYLDIPLLPNHTTLDYKADTPYQTKLCFTFSGSAMSHRPLPIPVSIQTDFRAVLQPRKYQVELATPGIQGHNYICVAPTGTGKTLVAALVIASHLQQNKHKGNCHVMFIVNTKPLADQQTGKIKEYISNVKVETYTGEVEKRVADSFKENNVSVCTAGKLLDELRQGLLDFSKFSMMVFDECHHTRKSHPYAELMKMYLEKKMDGELDSSMQIIGMTASPGAGENPTLDEIKTIDHLVKLMALLDAKGGIKMVRENSQELQECRKSSTFTRKIMKPRNISKDPFITEIIDLMRRIEADLGLPDIKSCTFEKWSQRYEARVQKVMQPLEMSPMKKYRDYISGLKLLKGFCTALSLYMDLRAPDAIREMQELLELTEDAKATTKELEWKRATAALIGYLRGLPVRENPMLTGIRDIFKEKFEGGESRAIIFVRTKKHTKGMEEWISQDPDLKRLGISPGILTGHTSEKGGSGMTKVEQKDAMQKFYNGEVNVLIATSVAEEGLDVPECNTVIRYQHVSDEIAKVQTEGRARAENSSGYTIFSTSSGKNYQEMRNEELVLLVNKILEKEYFPTGEVLEQDIRKLQKEIILERKWIRECKMREPSYKATNVRLLCKLCKEFVCYGSDISTIGDKNYHYVVHEESFKPKYTTKKHKKPCFVIPTVFKVHKVHCAKCDSDWGVECFWPRGNLLPIVKCKSFIFEIDGFPVPVRQWSKAPFKCEPLISKIHLDSDNSDDE